MQCICIVNLLRETKNQCGTSLDFKCNISMFDTEVIQKYSIRLHYSVIRWIALVITENAM